MSILNDRIKEQRVKAGFTLSDVADKLNIKEATAQRYESGAIKNIKHETIVELAHLFGCSPQYLMGWDDNVTPIKFSNKKYVRIKVYGSVPAGIPTEAIEDYVDEEDIPEEWTRDGSEFIGLKVKGDSMYPKYFSNDTIIVRKQPDCESGQDAVVYVNGFDATLKTVVKNNDNTITLRPYNPEYLPKTYGPNDDPVSLLGIVIEIRRSIQ
ncbi:repressor LexA [Eubacterium callanderi]|uniref:Repressor LexA n=1 Tax=Eubacterium callanderi TaxID=53442 RepID=A0AB74F1E0_9FIRM|nr:XRE family transcriptional regulator [Eubacterium callanderi]MDY7112139.1 LexA repressor [Eubacterium callanderi]SHL87961.1 repressor LexA [Eubacterium callanderi]